MMLPEWVKVGRKFGWETAEGEFRIIEINDDRNVIHWRHEISGHVHRNHPIPALLYALKYGTAWLISDPIETLLETLDNDA